MHRLTVVLRVAAKQLFWSLLKIQSPPPLEVVLRHVKIITDREHSQLDRWRYPQTPVKVRRKTRDAFKHGCKVARKWQARKRVNGRICWLNAVLRIYHSSACLVCVNSSAVHGPPFTFCVLLPSAWYACLRVSVWWVEGGYVLRILPPLPQFQFAAKLVQAVRLVTWSTSGTNKLTKATNTRKSAADGWQDLRARPYPPP